MLTQEFPLLIILSIGWQRLTGRTIPQYFRANQEQRWLPGLLTLVHLVSSKVLEDSKESGQEFASEEGLEVGFACCHSPSQVAQQLIVD